MIAIGMKRKQPLNKITLLEYLLYFLIVASVLAFIFYF